VQDQHFGGDFLKLVLDADRPIYLQIKEGIERDVLNGVLAPGEQIPSNSRLVSFYGINPVTVLKGVNLLLDEGIIYKKRGLGMFVSSDAPEILRKRFREAFEREQLESLISLAAPLGIGIADLHTMIDKAWREKYDNL
jgi:DNA-binding transcriptional regulator YhcF (GntR family)